MLEKTEIQNPKSIHPTLSFQFEREWMGSVDFQKSLDRQEELKPLIQKKRKAYFLGFESKTPVISQGLRATHKDLLWSDKELKKSSLKILKVRRGGETTLHSPGQLIIYPIVFLPAFKMRIKDFLETLELITQSFFKDFSISTQKLDQHAGLSTNQGKLAFFGIHISQGVSHHGVSISVSNDLNLFSSIKSCGQAHRNHDKMTFYNSDLKLQDLFNRWADKAEQVLSHPKNQDFGI